MTQISGSKVITRTCADQFTIVVANGKATNGKGSITWAANRSITRTSDAVEGLLDYVFEITGSGSGINRNGEAFTVNLKKRN